MQFLIDCKVVVVIVRLLWLFLCVSGLFDLTIIGIFLKKCLWFSVRFYNFFLRDFWLVLIVVQIMATILNL